MGRARTRVDCHHPESPGGDRPARTPQIDAELSDLFRALGCDAETRPARRPDAEEAARDASVRVSIVVAGGGDGTVSGVAAGIVGSPAALGILPLGTLNHFAKDLGIPLDLRAGGRGRRGGDTSSEWTSDR